MRLTAERSFFVLFSCSIFNPAFKIISSSVGVDGGSFFTYWTIMTLISLLSPLSEPLFELLSSNLNSSRYVSPIGKKRFSTGVGMITGFFSVLLSPKRSFQFRRFLFN